MSAHKTKRQFSAGIVIYRTTNDKREYLLLKSSAGHWSFAKGKIEEGETQEQAALREAREESGLVVTIEGNFKAAESYFFRHGEYLIHKTVYFFVGCADGKVMLSEEHEDFVWLSYVPCLEQLTYAEDKEILEKAEAFLNETK